MLNGENNLECLYSVENKLFRDQIIKEIDRSNTSFYKIMDMINKNINNDSVITEKIKKFNKKGKNIWENIVQLPEYLCETKHKKNYCDTQALTSNNNKWTKIIKTIPKLKRYLKNKTNKKYKKLTIEQFYSHNFPQYNTLTDEKKKLLQLSPCGIEYITIKRDQPHIVNVLKNILKNVNTVTITDICGGIGIDAINFL